MIDSELVRRRYAMNLSTSEIAKELGVSQTAVWKRLRSLGVEMRPKSVHKGPRNRREPKPKEPKVRKLPRYKRLDMFDKDQVLHTLLQYDLMGNRKQCVCGSGKVPDGNFGEQYPLNIEWACDDCR